MVGSFCVIFNYGTPEAIILLPCVYSNNYPAYLGEVGMHTLHFLFAYATLLILSSNSGHESSLKILIWQGSQDPCFCLPPFFATRTL